MGYSQKTLEILQLMLEGCKTVILVFEGVRVFKQGGPLSVPLFIINMEPLIRSLLKVTTGVQVEPVCLKVEGFMDDVNVFLTRWSDLRLIDGIFRRYEKLTGPKVGASLGPVCEGYEDTRDSVSYFNASNMSANMVLW